MPNMAVQYRGPDASLITLTNELRAHYGQPARTYEYVTGYKDPGNFSGHNADSNGIVHAVDVFTDDFGDVPQPEGRALAERLRLVGKATNRFSYLIHDMGPGLPEPMIAGQFSGWAWQAYSGTDMHSDHIHISVADLYWGDPCPVPASVYNNTARWNVTGGINKPQSTTITPIKEATLSAAEVNQIIAAVKADGLATRNYAAALLVGEYTLADGKHPGIGLVVEENQRRLNIANAGIAKPATPAPVTLTDAQVAQITASVPTATLAALKEKL